MSKRTWMSLSHLLTLMFLAVPCGCSEKSVLEQRMQEFGYTPATLAAELIPRLKQAASVQSSAPPRKNGFAEQVATMEADRGGDGDRPNPNSVEAIAKDAATKLQAMTDGTTDVDALVEELVGLISASTELPSAIKAPFEEKLREASSSVQEK